MNTLEDVEKEVAAKGVDFVLSGLKEERASLHPDKNGGQFKTAYEEARYHFLNEAVNHVNDKFRSTQMIRVDQLPAIIETICKGLAAQANPPAQVEKNIKESFRADLHRKYMAPKVSSGVFAAITGFLFTQATALMEHPVVGQFFKSPEGINLLGIGFLGSVSMFIISWLQERGEEARSTYLLSEDALREIYDLMKHESENGLIELFRIRRVFTRTGRPDFRPMNIFFTSRLSSQVVDQILEVQLRKLEERKIIELVERPGIDKVYKLNA